MPFNPFDNSAGGQTHATFTIESDSSGATYNATNIWGWPEEATRDTIPWPTTTDSAIYWRPEQGPPTYNTYAGLNTPALSLTVNKWVQQVDTAFDYSGTASSAWPTGTDIEYTITPTDAFGTVQISAQTLYSPSSNFNYEIATDPLAQHQDRLRRQLRPSIADARIRANSAMANFSATSQGELVALQLLKSMVDTATWRKYLRYGFVTVQGASGLTYQIERRRWHLKVLRKGKKLCELCVGLRSRGTMPPTDEVVAKLIMAECDEPELWRRANVRMPSFVAPAEFTPITLQQLAVA